MTPGSASEVAQLRANSIHWSAFLGLAILATAAGCTHTPYEQSEIDTLRWVSLRTIEKSLAINNLVIYLLEIEKTRLEHPDIAVIIEPMPPVTPWRTNPDLRSSLSYLEPTLGFSSKVLSSQAELTLTLDDPKPPGAQKQQDSSKFLGPKAGPTKEEIRKQKERLQSLIDDRVKENRELTGIYRGLLETKHPMVQPPVTPWVEGK